MKRTLYNARAYLPKGQSLPEDVWRIRHRALCYLLRVHVAAIFAYGLLRGYGVVHSLTEAGIVAIFATLATTDGRRRRFTSAMAALGLVMSSAVIVHGRPAAVGPAPRRPHARADRGCDGQRRRCHR